jgi:hypothetical protein
MAVDYGKQLALVSNQASQILTSDRSLEALFAKLNLAEMLMTLPKTYYTAKSMILDYKSGAYTQLPEKTIILIVSALIYVVAQDFIPIQVDKIAVIMFAFGAVSADLATYAKWKAEQTEKQILDHSIENTTLHKVKVAGEYISVKAEDNVFEQLTKKFKAVEKDLKASNDALTSNAFTNVLNAIKGVPKLAILLANSVDITTLGLEIQFDEDKLNATVAGKHRYSVMDIDELRFFVAEGKHTLVVNPRKLRKLGQDIADYLDSDECVFKSTPMPVV